MPAFNEPCVHGCIFKSEVTFIESSVAKSTSFLFMSSISQAGAGNAGGPQGEIVSL